MFQWGPFNMKVLFQALVFVTRLFINPKYKIAERGKYLRMSRRTSGVTGSQIV
jgi:hypothetical protein